MLNLAMILQKKKVFEVLYMCESINCVKVKMLYLFSFKYLCLYFLLHEIFLSIADVFSDFSVSLADEAVVIVTWKEEKKTKKENFVPK